MKQFLLGLSFAVLLALSFFGGQYLGQLNKSEQNEQPVGYRENTTETTMFNGTSTASWADGLSVVYYRNLGITVASKNASGTLKFACSLADTEPVWADPQAPTNTFDYVQIVDTEDGTAIDGDTGITLNNTTDVRLFESNSNNFRWCNVNLGGTVFGSTTVRYKPADNS